MKRQNTWMQIIVLGMVLCLLVGCSAPPAAQSTQTPIPKNGPKAGHWEGEPSVAFDVKSSGTIRNFHIAANVGMDTCTIETSEIKIAGDQTFIISEWQELSDSLRSFIDHGVSLGATKPATKQGESGELVESKHLDGKFDTPDTVSGSYLVTVCEDNIYTTVKVPTWNAAWKKP